MDAEGLACLAGSRGRDILLVELRFQRVKDMLTLLRSVYGRLLAFSGFHFGIVCGAAFSPFGITCGHGW